MIMRYPEFLPKNGTIGYIAPSFGPTIEPYRTLFGRAQEILRAQGYKTMLGPNCFADCGQGKSNTPEACGAEINDFFLNRDCDIIISCGGGETMMEDLPYVDFDAIAKARPKWYAGYSDNTNLVFTLPTLADTAAIYGPCACDIGMEPLHPAVADEYALLKGETDTVRNYDGWESVQLKSPETPLAPYHVTEKFNMRVSLPGSTEVLDSSRASEYGRVSFSGRLIGGCLDCLVTLAGTRFDRAAEFADRYADDGIIWFIEACDLSAVSIRRALWQLDNAGWFKHVKGFLIGRPRLYDSEMFGLDRITAVTGQLAKYKVPILMDLDIGHLPPMMPIVAGACADVVAEDNHLSIRYRYV